VHDEYKSICSLTDGLSLSLGLQSAVLVGMALAEPRKTDSAVMVVNQNAMTPLHVAAGEGHLDVVRPILALIPDSFQGGQVNGAGESMCASPDEMTNKHWVLL